MLLAEGAALVLDWRRARRILVERLLARLGRGRLWRFLFGPLAFGFGLAFAGFGVIELIRAGESAF